MLADWRLRDDPRRVMKREAVIENIFHRYNKEGVTFGQRLSAVFAQLQKECRNIEGALSHCEMDCPTGPANDLP